MTSAQNDSGAPGILIADRPDVLVIGAGIIGLACAHELRGAGLRVEVIEGQKVGGATSEAAAGILAPFSESSRHPELTQALRESRDLWQQWTEDLEGQTGLAIEYDRSGSLHAALDDEDGSQVDAVAKAAEAAGEAVEILAPERLRERYPDLSPSIARAVHVTGEHLVDPKKTMDALRAALRRRGALIHSQRRVDRVIPQSDGVRLEGVGWRTDVRQVVVASGAWTDALVGVPRMIRPVRGQMIAYSDPQLELNGAIRVGARYALKRDAEVLIGATSEEVGLDESVTDEARDRLIDFAQQLVPKLRWKAVARQWCGLRPATADELPVVGRLSGASVVIATGHYRNGVLLAPWTARAVASLVRDEGTSPGEAFSPVRFDGDLPDD